MMMWQIVGVASGVLCMARGRLLQVGSHAVGGVAASVAVVKAKRRGEAAPPSFPLLQETCACHPAKSPPPSPQCLRRMHPRLTLEPSDLAFALLSSLIDFEIISANDHP